jgi:hypothetical protein
MLSTDISKLFDLSRQTKRIYIEGRVSMLHDEVAEKQNHLEKLQRLRDERRARRASTPKRQVQETDETETETTTQLQPLATLVPTRVHARYGKEVGRLLSSVLGRELPTLVMAYMQQSLCVVLAPFPQVTSVRHYLYTPVVVSNLQPSSSAI